MNFFIGSRSDGSCIGRRNPSHLVIVNAMKQSPIQLIDLAPDPEGRMFIATAMTEGVRLRRSRTYVMMDWAINM
ncbi:MAG: hypothetical protein LBT83_11250 [Tannerella sp.]|nr:hypothetical protein [Tannerella sp.]